MYEGHFGLRTAPFHITPDPALLLLTDVHKEALGAILYGIKARKGFVTITGEVGVGKTTVLRSAIEQLETGKTDIIYLVQPPASPAELLRLLHAELANAENPAPPRDIAGADRAPAEAPQREIGAIIADIHLRLLRLFERGRIVVVAIDEAQLLSVETLEALRLLSNFETRSAKLIQIVLVGQPELDDLLARHDLRQLSQRIAIRARIQPLGPAESREYVEHRLAAVTDRPMRIFTTGALRTLLKAGEGYPRRLNILCDNALMNAYGHGVHTVTTKIAREAVRTFAAQQERVPRRRPSIMLAAAAGITGLAVVAAIAAALPFWRDSVPAAIAANWPSRVGGVATVAAPEADPAPAPSNPESLLALKAAPPVTPEPQRAEQTAPPTPGRTVAVAPVAEPGSKPTDAIAKKLAELAPSSPGRPRGRDAHAQGQPGMVTRTIGRGDTIGRLCAELYGECGSDEIARIRAANPRIRDLSRVMVGQSVSFPGATGGDGGRR